MQYDTDWLVANLQDMVQLCRANTMTQTPRGELRKRSTVQWWSAI